MKRIARSLGLAALLALPATAQDQTTGATDDGNFLERKIEELLSGAGRQVIVTGFEGALSSSATLERMTIADDDGVWLTLVGAELEWNRSALLRGRLEVEKLTAEAVELPRLTASQPGVDLPKAEAKPFKLPDLPVSVQIGEVSIGTVSLGAPLLGEPVELSVSGSASLAGGEGKANLAVERIDGTEGALTLSGSFDNETEALTLDLSLAEPENGIAARLLDLPGRPSVELAVEGSGVLSDFQSDIRLATAGQERLAGQVRLLADNGDRKFQADLGGDLAPVFSPQFEPFFGPDIRLNAAGTSFADGRLTLDTLDIQARALELTGRVALDADKAPQLIDIQGRIADPGGEAVLLPVGSDLRVDGLDLGIAFDAARGPDWTADIVLNGLETPDADIARVALNGDGTIRTGAAGAEAVTAALTFAARGIALADPGAQAALGDSVDGRASLDWSRGNPAQLNSLTVIGASFAFDGAGALAQTDNGPLGSFDGKVEAADLAAFNALAGRSLGGAVRLSAKVAYGLTSRVLDVDVTGRAEDLAIDQRQFDRAFAGTTDLRIVAARDQNGTRVDTLSLTNDAASLNGTANISSQSAQANLSLSLPDASRIDPGVSGPMDLRLDAEGQPGDWNIDLDLTALGSELAFNGNFDDLAETPITSGTLRLSALDLARAAPLLDRDLGGTLALDLTGSAAIDLSQLQVSGRITGDTLKTGIPEADAALAGRAEIDLSAASAPDSRAIEVETLRLTSDTMTLEAAGTWDPGHSQARLTATSRDLTPFGRGLYGPLDLSAEIVEQNGGYNIDTTLNAFGADVAYVGRIEDPGTDAPRISGNAEVRGLDLQRIAGLTGRALSGRVAAQLTGFARTDLSEFQVDAQASTKDVITGISEADAALQGAGMLILSARKDGPQQMLQLDKFRFDSATAHAEGAGSYAPQASRVQLTASVPDLTPFGRGLSGPAKLSASGAEDATGWDVTAGAAVLGASFDFDGRIEDLDTDAPLISGRTRLDALNLARLRGIVGRPLSGTLNADLQGQARTSLDSFALTGTVTGQGLAAGIAEVDQLLRGTTTLAIDASKQAAGQPIRIARLSLDSPAVRLSAQGQYGAGQSAVTLDARLDNIGRFAPDFQGPATASGRIGEAGSGVSVAIDANGPGGITASATGTAALDFGTVNLNIRGAAPLALADPFIAPQSLAGTANFDLSINGKPGLPALSGTVTAQGARAVIPGPGIVLNDINSTVRLNGGVAQISATATKQAGGQLSVRGSVGLTGAQPVDLTAQLSDLVIEDPALYRTTAAGQLTLTGSLKGGALAAGTIRLGTTEIRVPSSGLGTAGPIPDLRHVNEPAPVHATRDRAGLTGSTGGGGGGGGGGSSAIGLDIQVIGINQIFVRGRGLDAELGGRLTITGSTANIIPAGRFELIRGRLDILGKRLDLTEGRITLQGDFKPYLRLVATTEANDTTLLIILEGPVNSPEITFESQPDLPQDEVLAQLLFGKSLTDISPLQAARLALAVRTLAGKGGEGMVGRLRSQFGLDDLDITTDEDGNAAVRAGAYLSENVYSDVTVSATGDTEVNLNLDITPNLTARGSVNNTGETSLGIFFEKDY